MIVALFTCDKHIEITKIAIAYYNSFLTFRITVVGPKSVSKNFQGINVKFVGDEEVKGYENLKNISQQFSYGYQWYLQQFLKLAFYIESGDDVLIIDGDTVISQSVFENIIQGKKGYYSAEKITQYNKLLIDSEIYLNPSKKSYICNFGFFERRNSGFYTDNLSVFVDRLVKRVKDTQEKEGMRYSSMDFSEYQINGQISERQKEKLLPLRFFRRADLLLQKDLRIENLNLKILHNFFKSYDCISYEKDHKNSFIKSVLAEIYFLFRRSW